ncbi:basic proline-rich protein-like [Hyaena hyaena]|uniref:basic proline-rich protein-like n=1 Tax=Hyaena hyaena TaxID=95912 RepID=UPI001922E8E3|nr:basic proline-rich protein-like [Hyaena hyaena]
MLPPLPSQSPIVLGLQGCGQPASRPGTQKARGRGSPSAGSSGRGSGNPGPPPPPAPYLGEQCLGDRSGPCGCLPGWRLGAGPNQEERSSPPSSCGSSALLSPSLRPLPLPLPGSDPGFLSALLYLSATFSDCLSSGVSPPLPPRPAPREDELVKGGVVPREGPPGPRRKGTAGEEEGRRREGRGAERAGPGVFLTRGSCSGCRAGRPHPTWRPRRAFPAARATPGRPPSPRPPGGPHLAAPRPAPARPQRGAEITSGCGSRSQEGPGRAHPCGTLGHDRGGPAAARLPGPVGHPAPAPPPHPLRLGASPTRGPGSPRDPGRVPAPLGLGFPFAPRRARSWAFHGTTADMHHC